MDCVLVSFIDTPMLMQQQRPFSTRGTLISGSQRKGHTIVPPDIGLLALACIDKQVFTELLGAAIDQLRGHAQAAPAKSCEKHHPLDSPLLCQVLHMWCLKMPKW